MMKLLFFIHSLSSGGAERVLANLSNYWAEKGWKITVVTMTDTKSDFYVLHSDICRISLGLARDSKNTVQALRYNIHRLTALRSVLKKERPDVAVGFMTTANILLALASRGLNIPAVGSERIHPPMLPLGRLWEWLRRYAYSHLDAVVALTRESASWLREKTGARSVAVIPNPVSWPLPRLEPAIDPRAVNDNMRQLLAVGRLAPQKGFDRLIDVFASLASRFPAWRLAILGEGPERQNLERRIERLGLGGRVIMPGAVGNVGDWYEAADLYVMTSRFEGFPNTLAEALAHGLPAVSVDCDTGPRDIVRHGIDGMLVPQNDSPALADALSKLMEDEDLRRRYAARAVEARERFSIERIAKKWERLFDEVRNGFDVR